MFNKAIDKGKSVTHWFGGTKLGVKLSVAFLLVGLLPLILVGWMSLSRAKHALSDEAFDKLAAICEFKKNAVEANFQQNLSSVQQMGKNPFVVQAFNDFDMAVDIGGDGDNNLLDGKGNGEFNAPEMYGETHQECIDALQAYAEMNGYADIYLLRCDAGEVIFSVQKDADFGEKIEGTETGLAGVWSQAVEGQAAISDIVNYDVCGKPVQFVAAPILEDGNVLGVVAARVSYDAISEIMAVRAGLGETGETYLVGPDGLRRSDSIRDSEDPAATKQGIVASVAASFANDVKLETPAVTAALESEALATAQIEDYRGTTVLSAYTPVVVNGDVTWALLAEMDESEAMAEATSIRSTVLWLIGIVSAIVIGFGLLMSRRIVGPIRNCAQSVKALANQDFSQRCDVRSQDEIGQMAGAINQSIDATKKAFDDIKEAADRERETQTRQAEEERQRAQEQRREVEQAEQKVQKILDVANRVARRDYSIELDVSGDDAIGQLGAGLHQFFADKQMAELQADEAARTDREAAEELRTKVDALLETVGAAAEGDLTREIEVDGDQPVDELAGGIGRMLRDLSNVIGQVTESAGQFKEGSQTIAQTAQVLAEGAQSQKDGVEHMSDSIRRLATSIDGIKENAAEAVEVAKKTTVLAEQGGDAVRKSVEAMDLIRTSSGQISEIIRVISEIASQTNLLALNAAIEAARAGEHGMGFAVVADEVRKLAERSNSAAGEISQLIRESTQRVEEGAELSENVGESLQEIVSAVEATATKIAEIAEATTEQAENAREVTVAIEGVSNVAEESASRSEEMAASSEELGSQASALQGLVSRFRTAN